MASRDDAISISSGSRAGSPELDRRELLTPVIQNLVTALGGLEQISATESAYVLGDSCLGCLRDLKKVWRKDDTDDERTVARIFWETGVLKNDLVPILLETAGKGLVEDKCALACADLLTAMTWPIDLAEELKELDEELDALTDYTTLIQAQRSYKASLLEKGVISALFAILLPPLSKGKGERQERDNQIINLVLHAFRNLAFIKDPPPNTHASGEQAEYANLQSKLIITFQDTHVLDALLTFASNADDPLFNPWNNLLLEIFYLLFRGVHPKSLALDQQQKTKEDLKNLLAGEARIKREDRKASSSRHSRFGTTISVKSGNSTFVLHRQQAITAETATVMDLAKKKVTKRIKKQDELVSLAYLSVGALTALQATAKSFIINCFNRFLASLLKDIRAERAKITEKDNLRLLFVTKWFLEFFIGIQEREGPETWKFTLVAQIVEQEWIPWVLKRVREAGDEKPKQWTELQAGIDCLAQLLLLIEAMGTSEIFSETAEILQHKLYYNGEILELSFESLRSYKDGSQSIGYLDSSINFAYVLLRVLEKWAKAKGKMVVRRKKKKTQKKKVKGVTEEEGIVDVPSDEDMEGVEAEEDAYRDSLTTFEAFEEKFAHPDITRTCLVYLGRFREFDSSESMKRVVGLLHRQAIRVKAEGLFFQVTTLELFHRLLKEEKTLPTDQPYKDLMQLVRFVTRKFFKAVSEDTFTLVEAFFPKNRGNWKKFSSYQPPDKGGPSSDEDEGGEGRSKKASRAQDSKHGPDVHVKEGYSWSEQLGIAMACLIEDDKQYLIDWVKEILIFVIGVRQRIISDTDEFLSGPTPAMDEDNEDDPDERLRERVARLQMPSKTAQDKFEDYMILCDTQDKADAVTKNPHMKLTFRLLKFFCADQDADELEWYVPAATLPDDLQRSLDVIDQFLKEPLDLKGKKAAELIARKKAKSRGGAKKARTTKRRRRGDPVENTGLGDEDDIDLSDPDIPSKKSRKKKEKEQYKSAQFIEDSDAELGDDEEFFRKELERKAKNEAAASALGEDVWTKSATMRAAGTKKRKKKRTDGPIKKFKTLLQEDMGDAGPAAKRVAGSDDEDEDEGMGIVPNPAASGESDQDDPPPKAKPRPRPKPRRKEKPAAAPKSIRPGDPASEASNGNQGIEEGSPGVATEADETPPVRQRPKPRRKARPSSGAGLPDAEIPAAISLPSSPVREGSSVAMVSSSSPGSVAGSADVLSQESDEEGLTKKGPRSVTRKTHKPIFMSDSEDDDV